MKSCGALLTFCLVLGRVIAVHRTGEEDDFDEAHVSSLNRSIGQEWRLALGGSTWHGPTYSFGCIPNKPCCMCKEYSLLSGGCFQPKKIVESNLGTMSEEVPEWAQQGQKFCCKWKTPMEATGVVRRQNAVLGIQRKFQRDSGKGNGDLKEARDGQSKVTTVGAECLDVPQPCEMAIGEDGQMHEVYAKKWGSGRFGEIMQDVVRSARKAFGSMTDFFKSLPDKMKQTFSWENLAKMGQDLKKELYNLVTTKEGWWKIIKVSAAITLTAVSLACPQCAAGVLIASAAWKVAAGAVDVVTSYVKGETNLLRAGATMTFCILGAVSSVVELGVDLGFAVMNFVRIDPWAFVEVLVENSAFDYLLAICDALSASSDQPDLDNIQLSDEAIVLDGMEEHEDAIRGAFEAAKDEERIRRPDDPETEVTSCGAIRDVAAKFSGAGSDDCPNMWGRLQASSYLR